MIIYVTLFFAGTGGMIGVAAQAGPFWTTFAVVLFLVMTGMSFYQRVKSGYVETLQDADRPHGNVEESVDESNTYQVLR